MKQNVPNVLKRLLTFVFLFLYALGVTAANFEVDGIAYNFINEKEVEVTKKTEKYSGVISIPEAIEYNGKSYSVTEIGIGAFSSCPELSSVIVPKSVTTINSGVFMYSFRFASVTLPEDSLVSIGKKAFASTRLSSIKLPKNLKIIETGVFSDCLYLTSIEFPRDLTEIGNKAFSYCNSLSSIVLPQKLKSIGSETFQYCSKLSSIIFSDSVERIGYGAFSKCSALTSITLPSKLTSVENFLFEDCSSLTSVIFPANVTSFGISVFSGCDKLNTIKVASSVPATVSEQTFDNFNRTLYVPTGSRQAYAEHAVWGKFKTIFEYVPSALQEVSADGVGALFLTSPRSGCLTIRSARAQRVTLCNSSGTVIKPLTLSVGENYVESLLPGVYFVNGQKTMVQ